MEDSFSYDGGRGKESPYKHGVHERAFDHEYQRKHNARSSAGAQTSLSAPTPALVPQPASASCDSYSEARKDSYSCDVFSDDSYEAASAQPHQSHLAKRSTTWRGVVSDRDDKSELRSALPVRVWCGLVLRLSRAAGFIRLVFLVVSGQLLVVALLCVLFYNIPPLKDFVQVRARACAGFLLLEGCVSRFVWSPFCTWFTLNVWCRTTGGSC